MKRAPALRGLSEQHHHGLVAARHLRLAAAGERPLEETIAQFLRAWSDEIEPHFRAEEEVLLPEFGLAAEPEHPLITRTLTEHVALRRSVRLLRLSEGELRQALAAQLGRDLDDHIHFEERVLFPAVEGALSASMLATLGKEL
jgi:iron-sulfur cluster repair protein YtfE (RIC family)